MLSIQLTLAKNFRLSAAFVSVSNQAETNLPGAYHAGHVAHCPSTASGSTRTRMKPRARPAPGPLARQWPACPPALACSATPARLVLQAQFTHSRNGPGGLTLLELSAVTDRGTWRSAQWPTE